ncbi:MAG: hypothetical protein U5K79_22510 [Cyclobacteriaceae bacterium]|nr:hypothetical protein [Cyclobacteriaceae bacterium]
MNGTIGGSASSLTWTGGTGIFINANQLNARYVPATQEQGTFVLLTLTTDDPAGVCFAASSQSSVLVNRLPNPNFFGLDAAYQVDDPSGNLAGFPTPGIFSGPGIVLNTFVPVIADTGVHVIRYTHTDINGCTNYAEQSTVVFALPEVEIGNPGPYCLNENPTDPVNMLPRTSKVGFTDSWSGNNVFSQIVAGKLEYFFNIPVAGVGFHQVNYTIVDDNTGAVTNEPRFIIVNDVPKVDFTSANNCIADTIQFVDLSVLDSANVFNDFIASWSWEIGANLDHTSTDQNPRIKFDENKPDSYYIRLTEVTKYNCSAFKTAEIAIGAIPQPIFTSSNLSFGQLSIFTDVTPRPTLSQAFPAGYTDPTTSKDSIWWDFEEATINGDWATYNTVNHQFSQGNKEYFVTMTVKTNLGCSNSLSIPVSVIQSISTLPICREF